MTILVVYYSWKGHTEKVAKELAVKLGAELARIEPAGHFNIAVGGMKAFMSMKAPIAPCRTDLGGIDTLVLATPVWAGKIPPFVSMYLSLVTNGEGKTCHIITERGNHGSDHPITFIRHKLEEKGIHIGHSAVTLEKEVDSGEYLAITGKFADEILQS